MNMTPFYPPFPTEALPDCMRKAVHEALLLTQAPAALVASSCLGAASIATQNLVDVQRREHLVGPVALALANLGVTGERKSSADKLFVATIREIERERDLDFEDRQRRYESELAVWKVKKKTAESALAKALKKGQSTEQASAHLATLIDQQPTPAHDTPLLLADATPAAIKQALRINGTGLGVFGSEASSILNGPTFSELAFFNELWDGGTVNIDRISTGRTVIEDCRLTVSMLLQPGQFAEFMSKRGSAARDLGFFARTLIAYPPTTQGTRFLTETPTKIHLPRFNHRVRSLLELEAKHRTEGGTSRELLKFSWQAQRRWEEIFNIVEGSVGTFGYLAAVKDYAAKYADNLARLAAIFHCFEGCEGDISLDTLERAQAICSWYLESFKHLFSPPPQPVNSQPIEDAEKLKAWLIEMYVSKGVVAMQRQHLSRFGPYRVRPAHRLRPALALLESWQVILPSRSGTRVVVELHPFFMNFLRTQGIVPQVAVLVT